MVREDKRQQRTPGRIKSSHLLIIDEIRNLYTGDGNLDSMVHLACERFLDSNPQSKQDAIEKLWDAWERLKTLEFPANKQKSIEMLIEKSSSEPIFRQKINDEANILTDIGNDFMIRHSEVGKTPISSGIQREYLFYRMLSLILFLLKSRQEDSDKRDIPIFQDVKSCIQFASFLDTEGSFSCHSKDGRPRLSMAHYKKDTSTMQSYWRLFPIGSFQPNTIIKSGGFTGVGKEQKRCQWTIGSKKDLESVVHFLDQYPLQSTQQKNLYEVWKQMVEVYIAKGSGSQELMDLMPKFFEVREKEGGARGPTKAAKARLKQKVDG